MLKCLLEKELDLLLECRELWKTDHVHATLSHDIEEVVALSIHIFKRFVAADERNQMHAFQEEVPFELTEQRRLHIEAVFRQLLPVFEEIAEATEYSTGDGYEIKRADEFGRVVSELRGMLTSDAEFFAGAAQERLCDKAIDALRSGAVVEMQEIGD